HRDRRSVSVRASDHEASGRPALGRRRRAAHGRGNEHKETTVSMASTRVLVAVASRYGATAEIGSEIGAVLADHGCQVTVADLETAPDLAGHEVVVLGSALYAGHWLKPAREYVERNADQLRERQVWL